MEILSESAIGGYLGLELPFHETNIDRAMVRTNSARSALKLVLNSIDAKKIWLPAYVCDAVVVAVTELGIAFDYYRVDKDFNVSSAVQLTGGECILIVDYYGLCGDSVKRNVDRFGPDKVIVDCSQAFFAERTPSLATIYSPRKFFGLPDGGLLYSEDFRICQPGQRDSSSESRMLHLMRRLANAPETGYQEYLDAEQAIRELPILGMSALTERLLMAMDYESVKVARAHNARYLHERLGRYNQLNLWFDDQAVPLCYPFLPNVKTASRSELINSRVFAASYWTEVLVRVEEGSFEWNMAANGLFLPCDQRYCEEDMDRIIHLLAIE